MAIKIIVDAGSNLFPKILKEKNLDILVLPMSLQVEDKTYQCYEDEIDIEIFSKQFYQNIRDGKKVNTTLINPYRFMDAFEEEIKKGNKIICYTMAKGISGTYQAAVIAAKEMNEKYQGDYVHVIDSMTAGFGEGLQAIHAYELIQKSDDFDEISEELKEFSYKVRSEFTVDKVIYLARTGRVNKIVAKLAGLLNIKVILKGNNDSIITMTSKVLGRQLAIKSLAKTCLTHIVNKNQQTVYIAHADDIEAAHKLKMLLNEGGVSNIEIYDYDLVTGSHVGPGALALFYIGNNRD